MGGFIRMHTRRLTRGNRAFSPAQVITLAFAVLILLGAGLLTTPLASRTGTSCGFLTALFTACSATCVTGLALVDTYTQWSAFGQVVLLVLIQVGGLGFMSIFTLFLLMLRAKLGMKSRMLLQQSYDLNDSHGVVRLVRRVIRGTAVLELAGAVILCLRFLQDFPLKNAVWMGIFHSVSAFCNAGFDLMGKITPGASLSYYATDGVVCITIMFLIVAGGIGFFVWQELMSVRYEKRRLSVYSRLALLLTAVLLLGGALLFGLVEWNNDATLGQYDFWGKVLTASFQSVTTRTAGFSTVSQAGLTQAGKAISCVWMLIGGCSGSTAGGMKTVTVGVLLLSALSAARGKPRLTVLRRTVSANQISMANAVVTLMVSLSLLGAIFLTIDNGLPFLDCLYETTSALGTVGLTADLTPTLNTASKLLLIIYMYFGRVGITTISMGFFLGNRAEERYRYADTKLMIG